MFIDYMPYLQIIAMSNTILVLKKTDSALSRTLKIVKKSQASQKRCLCLYMLIKIETVPYTLRE